MPIMTMEEAAALQRDSPDRVTWREWQLLANAITAELNKSKAVVSTDEVHRAMSSAAETLNFLSHRPESADGWERLIVLTKERVQL